MELCGRSLEIFYGIACISSNIIYELAKCLLFKLPNMLYDVMHKKIRKNN